MSKRTPLSLNAEGCVGACLGFAAQVLASTASPSQLCCSKDLLAPLVLEAHRLGQHAAKTESHGATAPRKLFQLLRAKDGAGISTELRGMEFGDMTWEFAGPVSQTLEIELQDLEERLQASFGENEQQSAAIMVISTSGTEACVIWEAKAHIKRLVYVCPGRVKVVKSTTELLKKILEEMPTLNAPGAGFALWTLFAKRPKSPAEPLLQASALEVQRKHRKSEETRVVITDVRRSPTPSIFAFGHVVKIEPAGPDEQDVRCNVDNQEVGIPSPSPGDAIPLTNAIESVQSVPHPAEALADESVLGDPVPASRYRSQAQLAHVSASLSGWKAAQDTADVTVRSPRNHKPSSRPLTWRSIDSKIQELPRARSHHQHPADGVASDVLEPVPSHPDNQEEDPLAPVHKAGVLCRHEQQQDPAPETLTADMPALAEIQHGAVVCTGDPETNASTTSECFESCSVPSDVCAGAVTDDQLRKTRIASSDQTFGATTGKSVRAAESTDGHNGGGKAAIPEALSLLPRKKPQKSIRDGYKSKLGVRVWWELEYQTKFLLEQQACSKPTSGTASSSARPPAGKSVPSPRLVGSDVNSRSTVSIPQNIGNRHQQDECKHLGGQGTREGMNGLENIVLQTSKSMDQGCSCSRSEGNALDDQVGTADRLSLQRGWTGLVRSSSACRPEEDDERPDVKNVQCPPKDDDDAVRALTRPIAWGEAEDATVRPKPLTTDLTRRQAADGTDGRNDRLAEEEPNPTDSRLSHRVIRVWAKSTHADQDKSSTQQSSTVPGLLPSQNHQLPSATAPKAQSATVLSANEVTSQASRFQSEKRDDSDDDDEKSALEAWGNTRFQKQPSADSDGLILSHEKLTIPFNHLGRVPMRPERRKHSLQKDPDDCSSAIKPDFRDQATSLAQPSKNPNELGSSPHSTFVMIDLHEPAQHSSKKTRSPTRQEKLHNLRQKKIQQLQQRRNKELAAATEPTATSGGVYPSVTKPKADLHPTSTMIAPLAKARRPSNRKLIQNAIEYTVLAGVSVEKERAAALQALAESTCDNFILLLKSSREMKFRGLYEFHADSDRVVRVYSLSVKCPQELTPDSISQFFRYNSGKKEFLPVDTRSFTVKTDACALLDQLVFKNTARSQLRHLL